MFSSADRGSSVRGLLSFKFLMMPALIAYGFLVDPLTGNRGIPCIWRICFGVPLTSSPKTGP